MSAGFGTRARFEVGDLKEAGRGKRREKEEEGEVEWTDRDGRFPKLRRYAFQRCALQMVL